MIIIFSQLLWYTIFVFFFFWICTLFKKFLSSLQTQTLETKQKICKCYVTIRFYFIFFLIFFSCFIKFKLIAILLAFILTTRKAHFVILFFNFLYIFLLYFLQCEIRKIPLCWSQYDLNQWFFHIISYVINSFWMRLFCKKFWFLLL